MAEDNGGFVCNEPCNIVDGVEGQKIQKRLGKWIVRRFERKTHEKNTSHADACLVLFLVFQP